MSKDTSNYTELTPESSKQIFYFSHNIIDGTPLNNLCRQLLLATGIPIVSVTLKPIKFGENIVLDMEPGKRAYYKQIAAGLKACTADVIYFCEHDCLYHPSHFQLLPNLHPIMFNRNQYRCLAYGAHKTTDKDHFMSALIGRREVLAERMQKKQGFVMEEYAGTLHLKGTVPILDIRHKKCASTPYFRSWKDLIQRPMWMKRKTVHTLPYWGNVYKLRKWLLSSTK
jgi:hypothetical protein